MTQAADEAVMYLGMINRSYRFEFAFYYLIGLCPRFW